MSKDLSPKEIADMLADSKTKAVAIDLTDPKTKARYQKISEAVIDLLRERTNGPMEAYMILRFVVQTLEEAYDIKGGFIVGDEEKT